MSAPVMLAYFYQHQPDPSWEWKLNHWEVLTSKYCWRNFLRRHVSLMTGGGHPEVAAVLSVLAGLMIRGYTWHRCPFPIGWLISRGV